VAGGECEKEQCIRRHDRGRKRKRKLRRLKRKEYGTRGSVVS
jgi:hypothetical protein